ncbi:MAG: protein kinase domain-containing protein [Planctomycetales bacterium]
MPTPFPCPSPEFLKELLLGRLAGAEAKPLVEHLEVCDACQTSVQGLDAEDTLVQAIRGQTRLSVSDYPVIDQLIGRVSGLVVPVDENYCAVFDPPGSPDELGRLGPYRILRVLGTGGMGLVFQAEEQPLGRLVALKIIKPSLAAHPTVRERFLREARAIAAIDDERIVPIYHVGEERGIPYIAMQLLDGQTVEQQLREFEQASGRRVLPVADAVHIGIEVAHGLAAAHARGVIHRDVKPGNIFLKGPAPFAVRLLDFGLARGIDEELSLTQPGTVAGTRAYVAPEQIAGGPIDPRCDLYGLGCTLYRLTVGRTPLALEGLVMQPGAGREGIVPPRDVNPEVPGELSDFILQLLANAPTQRPPSARAVAERLVEIGRRLASGGTQASKSIPARMPALGGRRRQMAMLTAAGLTLACGSVAIVEMNNDREGEATATVLPQPGLRPAVTDPFEAWEHEAAALPREQQVAAVANKLKELNPGFDGQLTHRFEGRRIVELHFFTDRVTDIRPVRALRDLEFLVCRGSEASKGQLVDLSPLHDLRSLIYIDVSANRVQNLWPLRGLSLREVVIWANPVQSLEPLRGMRLTAVDLRWTFVADLSPIENQPVTRLIAVAHYLTNLEPLGSMPLEEVQCQFRPERHEKILRNIKTLRRINGQPVDDFWREFDARREWLGPWVARTAALPAEDQVQEVESRLREHNTGFNEPVAHRIEGGRVISLEFCTDNVTDISALRALTKLTRLAACGSGQDKGFLFDLDPIRELPLEELECGGNDVCPNSGR